MNCLLLKTEPDVYSFQDLEKEKVGHWNGVRNHQAKNHLKSAKKGDLCLIYHTGDERQIVGMGIVVKEAYPDLDKEHAGDWVQFDVQVSKPFKKSVTLAQIKATPAFKDFLLVTHSRLSVVPVSQNHLNLLLKMGETTLP